MSKSPGPHKSPRGLTMRSVEQTSQNVATQPQTKHRQSGLKPASNWPQAIEKPPQSSLMKHPRARTKQKRLKPRPQNGSYTKHEQESPRHQNQRKWKALQTFTQTYQNAATHSLKPLQTQTTSNQWKSWTKPPQSSPRAPQNYQQLHQNMLQTFGSRQSTCLNHSLLDSQSINTPAQSQSTNQETTPSTNKPTSTDQPTKQPTPSDRPTDRPASQPANQPNLPTNQPTNKPASPADLRRARPEANTQRTSDLPPSKTWATFRSPKRGPQPVAKTETSRRASPVRAGPTFWN